MNAMVLNACIYSNDAHCEDVCICALSRLYRFESITPERPKPISPSRRESFTLEGLNELLIELSKA